MRYRKRFGFIHSELSLSSVENTKSLDYSNPIAKWTTTNMITPGCTIEEVASLKETRSPSPEGSRSSEVIRGNETYRSLFCHTYPEVSNIYFLKWRMGLIRLVLESLKLFKRQKRCRRSILVETIVQAAYRCTRREAISDNTQDNFNKRRVVSVGECGELNIGDQHLS